MPSSSHISRRQGRRLDILSKSLKCKYCDRWFKNASGRTKHVGVYHPRGEADLRRAFEANGTIPLRQTQPSSEELDDTGMGTDLVGDTVECIDNGKTYVLLSLFMLMTDSFR